MNIETICIDLGASYTKIGYRPACDAKPGRPFEQEAEVFQLGGQVLIPSLAIQTKDRKSHWIFGHDASNLRLSGSMRVHTNWKAGLYGRKNDQEAARAAIVAKEFFGWLKTQLDPIVPDWNYPRVRVTLPAFADANNLVGVVRECMQMAGWRPAELEFTTEPHANAIGLLTVGRNIVTRGRAGLLTDLGKMFGQGNPYIAHARAVALQDHPDRMLRVAIVDIGAFTTDVAKLEFDVATFGANSDGLSGVEQESFTVGTHDQFDAPLWKELEGLHGIEANQLNYAERESVKINLLTGTDYSVVIDGKRIKYGDGDDFRAVRHCADQFAAQIWAKISPALSDGAVDVLYLTGGGSQIDRVSAMIDKKVPKRAHQPDVSIEENVDSGTGWINWRTAGTDIGRLATAIGGVSVLQLSQLGEVKIGLQKRPTRRELAERAASAGPRPRECTCRGNRNCPICGGTGYLPIH